MIAGTCRSQPCFISQRGTPNFKGQGWLKDFWGFEIFNVGIFFFGEGVGKFWQVSSIWRFMVVPTYPCCMVPQINFYGSEIRHGIFGGVKCQSRDFFEFYSRPREFLGFWFLPPFDHPCHLKSGVPPWALALLRIIVFVQCFLFLFRRIKTKECFYLTWPVPDGPVWITFFPMCCNNFAACS